MRRGCHQLLDNLTTDDTFLYLFFRDPLCLCPICTGMGKAILMRTTMSGRTLRSLTGICRTSSTPTGSATGRPRKRPPMASGQNETLTKRGPALEANGIGGQGPACPCFGEVEEDGDAVIRYIFHSYSFQSPLVMPSEVQFLRR